MTSGRTVMAIGWNGDGQAVIAKKPAAYVIPDEGAEFWIHAYCVPKDAKNPYAAHAWINYCYDTKGQRDRDRIHVLRLAAQA